MVGQNLECIIIIIILIPFQTFHLPAATASKRNFLEHHFYQIQRGPDYLHGVGMKTAMQDNWNLLRNIKSSIEM
jgi:hypothetical protein